MQLKNHLKLGMSLKQIKLCQNQLAHKLQWFRRIADLIIVLENYYQLSQSISDNGVCRAARDLPGLQKF